VPPPPAPAACRPVASGEPLAELVAAAAPGTAFCLAAGEHAGPLVLGEEVTVWGPAAAIVRSGGHGDTVRLTGAGAALLGLTVDGSGHRFDLQEAAVHLDSADGGRIEGIVVRNALFGIIVERSRHVEVRGNRIEGSGQPQLGLRGDAIRVWETSDSRIERNHVTGGRDVVAWYSPGNVVEGNEVVGGRYGTHFMYSHGNRVRRNRYVGNVVGVFAMYSRDLRLEENLVAASTGAAGMGLGLKESSSLVVRANLFVRNTTGIYLDNSPYEPEAVNRFAGNRIEMSGVGIDFHASTRRNRFTGNLLRANAVQVQVDGGGDALGNEWLGNDFDDYAGYDLDRDGFGDVPYEARSLSGTLVASHPQLAWFHGTPALFLLDAASHVVPLLRPRPILVDRRPATGRRPSADEPEAPEALR